MFKFDQAICEKLFFDKYCLHGEKSVEEVFEGISEEISSVESNKKYWKKRFYEIMINGYFIPGGRILANARLNSTNKYYSNCFALGIEDSLDKIYDTLQDDALISSKGGGVGVNFSTLRPKDDVLKTKGGQSSGPISFMKVFNESGKIILTGGSRRSARLGILDISHPDIEEYIICKQNNKILDQMNISVMITDEFMKCVKEDSDWNLIFNGKIYKTVKAKYLYDLLCKNAYKFNDPGVLFYNTINRYNNGFYSFNINTSNACSELPLNLNDACNLGSLNLTKFVVNPFTENAYFNFNLFSEIIPECIRFLDNVIDTTMYPLKKIEETVKKWRRVGLGFTGLADAFSMLNIKYGSEKSKEFANEMSTLLRDCSYSYSTQIAAEKGKFSEYSDKILESNFIKNLPEDIVYFIKKYGLRNISLNCVAPVGTGSITIGNNVSSGIEPIFSLEYERRIRTENVDEYKKEKVYDYAYLLYLNKFNNKIPDTFVTIKDINVYDQIDIQSIIQKNIDSSISKCVAKGTLISTNKGIIPIEKLSNKIYSNSDEFSDVNNNYLVLDEFGKEQKIISHYYNGIQDAIKIRCSNGFELEGSFNHKLKTDRGWVSLDKIQIGDFVFFRNTEIKKEINEYVFIPEISPYNNIKRSFPKYLDEDFAKFIGMLLSDGHIDKHYFSIVEKDDEVCLEISRLFNKLFKKESISVDKRNGVRTHYLCSTYLSSFFCNWLGDNAVNKKVPEEILLSKKSVQISFLEGLSLDGYISQKSLIIYDGYSKDIAFKVANILSSFGLRYLITSKKVKNGKLSDTCWGIRVYDNSNIIKTIESHKNLYESQGNGNLIFVPENIREELKILPKCKDKNYYNFRNIRKSLLKSNFVRASLLRNLNLLSMVDGDLSGLRVTDKQYTGKKEMYDIEVENTHSYLLGGFISHNTLNLPKGTSFEDYKKIFMYAYEKGVKGITTFNPDGNQEGIINYTGDNKKVFCNACKRPKDLECDVERVKIKDSVYSIIIGLVDGKPYEIFGDKEHINISETESHKGIIRKIKKKQYSLIMDEKVVIENISKQFDHNLGVITRLVSLSLRHNVDLEYVVDQLLKTEEFVSFSKSCARVLKKYIPENKKVTTSKSCPSCGSTELIFKEGCVSCQNCGYSACS